MSSLILLSDPAIIDYLGFKIKDEKVSNDIRKKARDVVRNYLINEIKVTSNKKELSKQVNKILRCLIKMIKKTDKNISNQIPGPRESSVVSSVGSVQTSGPSATIYLDGGGTMNVGKSDGLDYMSLAVNNAMNGCKYTDSRGFGHSSFGGGFGGFGGGFGGW